MEEDRPPMPSRDRGFSATINNPDDGTPIKEMVKVDGNLLMVTEKCTYRLQVADQVDPKRTNSSLAPVIQQKLFDHGTKSELMCRSLLHADTMFRTEFLKIDVEKAKSLALEAFSNLVAMQELATSFAAREDSAIAKVQSTEHKDKSATLPAVGNVREDCKSFCQKAVHFSAALLDIVRLFYPEMKSQGWEKFYEVVKARHGAEDSFNKVLESAIPLLQLLKAARDCLDHRLDGVITSDFSLNADGTGSRPWIEIDFKKSKHSRIDISAFMRQATHAALIAFEMITVHACARNAESFGGLAMTVDLVPDHFKATWHGRFCYGSYFEDGGFVPCG